MTHKPTEDSRKAVEAVIGMGATEEDTAAAFNIAPKTLRKHYRAEIDNGKAKIHGKLRETLYNRALDPEQPASILIFACKTQLGMKEVERTELTGADGAPLSAGEFSISLPDNGRFDWSTLKNKRDRKSGS